jgi:hypothetical protein
MIWAFVDYENTGSLKGISFDQYQRIFIFCGPKNSKINIGDAAFSEFLKIEIIKLKTTGANNLDFHIAYYLGKFSQIANQDVQFHIITRDNGFNGLVNHIKNTGRKCNKITINLDVPSKKISLSPCAELTVKRLKPIDGRSRSRKEQKLTNWIDSQCKPVDSNVDAKKVLNELVGAGLIIKENNSIKYKFKT